MGPLFLLIFLGTVISSSHSLPLLSQIRKITEFNNNVAATLYRAHKLSITPTDSSDVQQAINFLDLFLDDTKAVIEHLTDNYPITLSDSMQTALQSFIDEINESWGFLNATGDLLSSLRLCDEYYKNFVDLLIPIPNEENSQVTVNKEAISEFVDSVSALNEGQLEAAVNTIHNLVTSGMIENVYVALLNFLLGYNEFIETFKQCDYNMTMQDSIKAIYDLVIVNEIRMMGVTIFALNHKTIVDNASTEEAISGKITNFISRTSLTLKSSKSLLKTSSFHLLRCDPEQNILDENCFRLNDLFTDYYVNMRQISDTCNIDLPTFSTNNYIECLWKNDTNLLVNYYCPSRQCSGKLHNCRKVPAMGAFCESLYSSGPRYLWIENNNQASHQEECAKEPGVFVDTLMFIDPIDPCGNLVCQCSEGGAESSATRAINLNPQMADISNNMVVTNIRFIKQDNMVHLQIEQGKLLPAAKIDPDTIELVPIGNFRYLQNTDEGSFVMINPENEDEEIYLKYDMNYTFLRHDHNEFHLDDIIVDDDYVVTGVRLNNANLNPEFGVNISPIEIQVHATKFDYHNGVLLPYNNNGNKWFTSKNMKNKKGYEFSREPLDLSSRKDSLDETYVNMVDSVPNQRIQFQPSAVIDSLKQNTIPYFDSRPPVNQGLRALSGIGIIHRGTEITGGYLAPKLIAVDHEPLVLTIVTDRYINQYSKNWKN